MNIDLVDKLARATLYEGYALYPYRPSVKNTQRWTFGGIYPRRWCENRTGRDSCRMQTELLMRTTDQTRIRIIIRFLHLVDRKIGELATPLDRLPVDGQLSYKPVSSLRVGDDIHQAWQEAQEREVDVGELELAQLLGQPRRTDFDFHAWRTVRPLRAADASIVGLLIRRQQAMDGSVEVCASAVDENLCRLSVKITNETWLAEEANRDQALLHSLVSAHTILGVEGGEFVSQTDPPDELKEQAARCENAGAWPVLVGHEPQRDTVLSSPIILYDYPELAPESPGDLFDATEIDEILTLRILTMTEEEKRAAISVDHRVRDMMSRTEALAREQLMNLHGTMRGLRPVPMEQDHG